MVATQMQSILRRPCKKPTSLAKAFAARTSKVRDVDEGSGQNACLKSNYNRPITNDSVFSATILDMAD